jgi:hypothetical protein
MSFDPRYYIEDRNDFAPTTDVEKAFEKLDSNGVRWVVERALKSDEEKQAGERFQTETVPLFKKMYPAYIDNDHNMKLMQHHWKTKFGVEIPSLVQVEESFFDLRNAGVVNLNAKAVAKEQADVIAQRHDEIIALRKESEFDEAAAYTMPMEELERRGRGF